MIEVIEGETVILISEKGEYIKYHHVGDLDSGMCYLTDKNGKAVYAGRNEFCIFVSSNLESKND